MSTEPLANIAIEAGRMRWRVRVVIRAVGAAMILFAATTLVTQVALMAIDGIIFHAGSVDRALGMRVLNLVFLCVGPTGIGLWLFAPLVARVAVPIPKAACHNCAFSFKGIKPTRCPECGTIVDSTLHSQTAREDVLQ
jgi:hypothetical protein